MPAKLLTGKEVAQKMDQDIQKVSRLYCDNDALEGNASLGLECVVLRRATISCAFRHHAGSGLSSQQRLRGWHHAAGG